MCYITKRSLCNTNPVDEVSARLILGTKSLFSHNYTLTGSHKSLHGAKKNFQVEQMQFLCFFGNPMSVSCKCKMEIVSICKYVSLPDEVNF
jgi:hypothetical protein